jgi:hypothetical protein
MDQKLIQPNHIEYIEDDSLCIDDALNAELNNTEFNTRFNESIGSSYSIDLIHSKIDNKILELKQANILNNNSSKCTRYLFLTAGAMIVCASVMFIVYLVTNSSNRKIYMWATILIIVASSMCYCKCMYLRYQQIKTRAKPLLPI